MRKHVWLAAAPAMALALVLSACTSPAATSTSNASSAGVNGKKVLIALSAPESGPGAAAAAYTDGVKAYLDYVNSKGGVNGYTFQVSTVDNQGDAAGGAAAIRQIIAQKPFATVIDGSGSFQSSVSIIKSQDPDLVTLGLGNAQIIQQSGIKNVFGLFSNYIDECEMQVNFAVNNLGDTKLALVYENSPTGQGPAASCPAYAKAHGATQIKSYAVPTPQVSTNYGPIAAQIAQQDAQLVLFFGSDGEMVGLQKAMFGIGSNTKWLGFAPSYDVTYLQLAGPAAIGTYFDAFAEPVNSTTAEAKLFRQQMDKRAPKSANSSGGYGWSEGAIIQQAVKAATAGGSALTQDSFSNAMRHLNLGQTGLLYKVNFSKDPSQSTNAMNIYQVTPSGLNLVAKNQQVPGA